MMRKQLRLTFLVPLVLMFIVIFVCSWWGKTIASYFENPNEGTIEKMPVEGADVAQLLRMSAWKWKVRLPRNARGAVYWVEDWRKGATQPHVGDLGSGLGWPIPSSFVMMMKIPTEHDATWVRATTSSGNSFSTGGPKPEYLPGKLSQGMEAIESETVAIDKDITLLGVTQTDEGFASTSYKAADRAHNRIILYKMRFTTNKDSASPYWKNGAIAFKIP